MNTEQQLKEIWGDEIINSYLSWLFEYANKEASFLQLKATCESEQEYKDAFHILCCHRRRVGLEELMDCTDELCDYFDCEYDTISTKCKLEVINSYSAIEKKIHDRYFPPKNKDITDNIRLLGGGTTYNEPGEDTELI